MLKKNRKKIQKAEEIIAKDKLRKKNGLINFTTALTLATLIGLSFAALVMTDSGNKSDESTQDS